MSGTFKDSAVWSDVEKHLRTLHEPMFGRPHRIFDASVSRDGSRLVVSAEVYDDLVGLPRQVVCLVADGEIQPITAGVASCGSARIAPDGDVIAALSDRAEAGRMQVHLLRDRLGEAEATPAVPGTVEYLAWSPDGGKLLLGVAGLEADLSGGQGSGRVRRAAADRSSWEPLVDTGSSDEAWRSTWVLDLTSLTVQRVSPVGLNVWEAAWLGPDALVAVTSTAPSETAWYSAVLTRIGMDGTTTELATSPVQLGLPAATADGRRLAVVQAVCSDRWVVAGDLLVGRPGQPLAPVDTAGVDVTATQWIDDHRLGVIGLRGLETVAAVVDVEAGTSTEVWRSTDTSCGRRYPDACWTSDGRLLLIEEGYRLPQRVVAVDGSGPKTLAAVEHPGTDYLLSVAGDAEAVSWAAPDGLTIEGILCKPEGPGPFPLVVNIHGGPVWSYRNLWSLGYASTPLLVANGYAVLHPNPRGSSGRGQGFAAHVFGDMGGADTWDFTSAVDDLVARGVVDPERVGLSGGSYGGYMSCWLVTQDQRWAAAVPVAPVSDWYSQHFTTNIPHFDALFLDGDPEKPGDNFHARSPIAFASRVRTPCLTIAGALDRCTPPTQAQEFHQALVQHGIDSVLAIYPEEGHGVRAFPAQIDYCARILDWFQQHMPAGT